VLVRLRRQHVYRAGHRLVDMRLLIGVRSWRNFRRRSRRLLSRATKPIKRKSIVLPLPAKISGGADGNEQHEDQSHMASRLVVLIKVMEFNLRVLGEPEE